MWLLDREWGRQLAMVSGEFYDWAWSPGPSPVIEAWPGPYEPKSVYLKRPQTAVTDDIREGVLGPTRGGLDFSHLRGRVVSCVVDASRVLDLRCTEITALDDELWRAVVRQLARTKLPGVIAARQDGEALVLFPARNQRRLAADQPTTVGGDLSSQALLGIKGQTGPSIWDYLPQPMSPAAHAKWSERLNKRLRIARAAFDALYAPAARRHRASAVAQLTVLADMVSAALADPAVGPAYLRYLEGLIPALYIEHAYAALRGDDLALKLTSAATVSQRRRRPCLTPLLEASTSADWIEREGAASGLAELVDPRARSAIELLVRDPEPQVRSAAISRVASSTVPHAPQLLLAALDDTEPEVRALAARGMERLERLGLVRGVSSDGQRAAIRRLLDDPDPTVQRAGIRLGLVRDDTIGQDAALRALEHPDKKVKILGLVFVARFGTPEALPHVLRIQGHYQAADLQGESLKALAAIQDLKATARVIDELLGARYSRQQRRAAKALARSPLPAVVLPPLLAAAQSRDPSTAGAASHAIMVLGMRQPDIVITTLLETCTRAVRKQRWQLIKRINSWHRRSGSADGIRAVLANVRVGRVTGKVAGRHFLWSADCPEGLEVLSQAMRDSNPEVVLAATLAHERLTSHRAKQRQA
jgi:HEAT repeat protein